MVELGIARRHFERLVRDGVERLARNPRSRLFMHDDVPVTASVWPGGTRLLAYRPLAYKAPVETAGALRIVLCRSRQVFNQRVAAARSDAAPAERWQAWLIIGTGKINGRIAAYARAPGAPPSPIDRFLLTGPRVQRVFTSADTASAWAYGDEMWSRSRAALGHDEFGQSAWENLTGDHFTIIGSGRTASVLLQGLANLGVRSGTLLDPDLVEPHNWDGMVGISAEHLGRPKVEALRDAMERLYPWTTLRTVQATAASAQGIETIKGTSGWVLAAVDNGRSLLQVHALCSIYARNLLTCGTRLRRDALGVEAVADVGVFYGGELGCCLCVGGGFPAFHRTRRDLEQLPEPEEGARRITRAGGFQEERAGSLLSLNTLAVGHALTALQASYGDLQAPSRSYMTRLSYEEGLLQTRTEQVGHRWVQGDCLCCVKSTGDAGLEHLKRYAQRSRMSFSPEFR